MADQSPQKPQQPQPGKQPAKPASARQSGEMGIDPVMADLVKSSAQATAKSCPQCKTFLNNNAVICTSCGYDMQTGKTLSTRVHREKAAKAPKEASNIENPLTKDTPWIFFGLFFVLGLAPGLLALNDSLQPVAIAVAGVAGLATLALCIFVFVVAFRESVGQGVMLVVCLLLSCLFIPYLYLLYYVLFKTEDVRIKGGFSGSLLAGIISFAMSWGALQEEINSRRNAPVATPPAATGQP